MSSYQPETFRERRLGTTPTVRRAFSPNCGKPVICFVATGTGARPLGLVVCNEAERRVGWTWG